MNKTTNIEFSDLVPFYELPEHQQESMKDEYGLEQAEAHSYFKYGYLWFSLGEFMRSEHDGWDGYLTMTNTSSMVIKLNEGYDTVTVGIMG